MIAPQLAEDAVQISLLSTGSHGFLAREALAQHFGITTDEAESVLARGRGVFVPRNGAVNTEAARALFASLGLQLVIEPRTAPFVPETYDLSIRLAVETARMQALSLLNEFALGGLNPAFDGPAGLVLSGLSSDIAAQIRRSSGDVTGVQVTSSAQADARYDIFACEPINQAVLRMMTRHLAIMGCNTGGPTDALATDLDRRTMKHLLVRFPDCGLVAVNQAFQRYRLTVSGHGSLTLQDFQDFLATRGVPPAAGLAQIKAGAGLVLESGLSRSAALQFLEDYATIGMPARIQLILN